ncbi:MAG: hypothetical protein AAF682_12555 [Planctomycetota bacterium]
MTGSEARFGERLFGGSPFLFWALAPALLVGAAVITLPPDYADGFALAAVLFCDAAALLLLLALWPYHRVPGARRLLTGLVFAAALHQLGEAWVPAWVPSKGTPPARLGATLGFLAVGLPCLTYALFGRFRRGPAAVEVPSDDPLLHAAYRDARQTLPRLRELFPARCEAALVHFPFATDTGAVENLWGLLLELGDAAARVRVLTPPFTHEGTPPEEWTVALDELLDWEAELPDGTVAGGYGTRALCAYAERESLPIPWAVRRRLRRYRDAA